MDEADKLQKEYNLSILSMGMTDSYAVAIEEGATMVRIGKKLFNSYGTSKTK